MKLKKLAAAGIFTALMCVLSPLSVPLPFAEVSFSLGVLAVFICASAQTPLYAVGSSVAYILLGFAGLPVFSGYKSGAGVILGPTGGFLLAYPFMALLISAIIKKSEKKSAPAMFACMLLSLIICYGFGAAGYSVYVKSGFTAAFAAVCLPFLPFDAAKAVIGALVAEKLRGVIEADVKPVDRGKKY